MNCITCHSDKEPTEFHRSNTLTSGRESECKACKYVRQLAREVRMRGRCVRCEIRPRRIKREICEACMTAERLAAPPKPARTKAPDGTNDAFKPYEVNPMMLRFATVSITPLRVSM